MYLSLSLCLPPCLHLQNNPVSVLQLPLSRHFHLPGLESTLLDPRDCFGDEVAEGPVLCLCGECSSNSVAVAPKQFSKFLLSVSNNPAVAQVAPKALRPGAPTHRRHRRQVHWAPTAEPVCQRKQVAPAAPCEQRARMRLDGVDLRFL